MFELRHILNKNNYNVVFHHNNIQYVVHEMLSCISNDTNANYIIVEREMISHKKHQYITNEISYNKSSNTLTCAKPINIVYDKAITDIFNKLHSQFALLTPNTLKQTQAVSKADSKPESKTESKTEPKTDPNDKKLIEKINVYKSDKLYYSRIKNNEIPEMSELFKNKLEVFNILLESKILKLDANISDDDLITEYINYQEIYDELFANNKVIAKTPMFDDIDPFMKKKAT